jgi:hypothetical protein
MVFSPKSSIFVFLSPKKTVFFDFFWDKNGNQIILFEFLGFKENNFLKYHQWQKDSKRCQLWHGVFKIVFFCGCQPQKKCASYGMGFSFFLWVPTKKNKVPVMACPFQNLIFLGGCPPKK